MTRIAYSDQDTPQQRAALKASKVAQIVRRQFPATQRVEGRAHSGTGRLGTVQRHVPQLNAQGGYLVVLWDNGATGRHSAISLARVETGASV